MCGKEIFAEQSVWLFMAPPIHTALLCYTDLIVSHCLGEYPLLMARVSAGYSDSMYTYCSRTSACLSAYTIESSKTREYALMEMCTYMKGVLNPSLQYYIVNTKQTYILYIPMICMLG